MTSAGWCSPGRWLDIGTPELYLDAHAAVFRGASAVHRPEHAHVAVGAEVAGDLGGAWAWVGAGCPGGAGGGDRGGRRHGRRHGRRRSGRTPRRDRAATPPSVADAIVTGASLVGTGAVVGAGCEIDHGMRVAPGARLAAGSVTFRPPK